MSLLSNYQNRTSTQIRTNISNPQSSGATTPDTAQETRAATDAEAVWEAIVGINYDDNVALHVATAVQLVVQTLLLYTQQIDQEAYDKHLERLEERFKLVLGRNRILPTTNSELNPTEETSGSKPFSDLSNFDRYLGAAPGGTSSTEDRNRE